MSNILVIAAKLFSLSGLMAQCIYKTDDRLFGHVIVKIQPTELDVIPRGNYSLIGKGLVEVKDRF